MNKLKELKDIIPDDFYRKLKSSNTQFRKHPLETIIHSLENPEIASRNQRYADYTLDSIIRVKDKYEKWFDKKWRKVLCCKEDFNAAIGALGEIRALNQLIDLRLDIVPIDEKNKGYTPDFEGKLNDKTRLYIEVYTPRMKAEAKEKKKELYKDNNSSSKKGIPEVKTVSYNPVFGNKKKIEYVISTIGDRIVGNKKDGEQAKKNECSLLWVDLISKEWNLQIESTAPYISKKLKGAYVTGQYGLWQSMYGKEGMKVFRDRVWLKFANDWEFKELYKDGYFRKYPQWSGIILAFKTGTVIYQNPWANNKLNEELIRELIRLNEFNLFYSWISSNHKKLKKKIDLTIQEIEEIYRFGTH